MAEEIHVESSWHHHHAGARFAAVPLAWTAAVVVEHAGRLNIAEWHEWGSGAEPIGHKAFHSESRASQEGNADADIFISGAAEFASGLLANPDTQPDANPHARCDRDPNADTYAGSDAHTRPHRKLHLQSGKPGNGTGCLVQRKRFELCRESLRLHLVG